jgi:hypothetical protein
MQYKKEDIRWRHVGNYEDKEEQRCILYDLSDLEHSGGSFVNDHHDEFNERSQEPEPQTMLLNARNLPAS